MVASENGKGNRDGGVQVDPRRPFNAWLDPGANAMGLGIVSVERVTENDVPVRVIPCSESSVRFLGDLLAGRIGARGAKEALETLGVVPREDEPWTTITEADCPECAQVWTGTVQETAPDRLELTHMAYGCDHRSALEDIEDEMLWQAAEAASDYDRALNDEAAHRGI